MPSVFGKVLAFNLEGLTEAQREALGNLLCAGAGVEPATLPVAHHEAWRAIVRRAHDVERQQQQEAALSTVTPTQLPDNVP